MSMTRLRLLIPFALAMVLMALPAFAGSAAAKEIPVTVADFKFDPKTITVSAGDTVVWTNTGSVAHTVTASDGSWDSGRLEPGKSFSHTFDTAGTVPYYCKPHGSPDGSGMAATVIVEAAAMGNAQPAPAAQATAAPAAQPTAAPAQPAGVTPSVDVSDQPLDQNYITIAKIVAARDGWIVVHTNTADNKPGPVIGHAPVKAGENDNVEVTLNPAPAAGDKLWPMLHIDAGQIGTYEFPGADSPVIVNGDIVMKQITVQGDSMAPGTMAPGAMAPGTMGQTPAAGASGGQTAQTSPRALPNTGDSAVSDFWIPLAGIALALLLGGLLVLRSGSTAERR